MFKNISILSGICLLLASCTDFDWHQEHDTLLTPFDITSPDIDVDLTAPDTDFNESHTIEWSASHAADYSQVFYKVLFSAAGDFDNPDYTLVPAQIGTDNSVSVNNTELNIIAEAAGIPQNGAGSVKWTVRASNGIAEEFASDVRTMTVSRPAGFAYIPASMTVRNAAGTTAMRRLADGVFESYIYLDGECTLAPEGENRIYGITGSTLAANTSVTPVSSGKIHHIVIDFNTATASLGAVESVALWYSGTGSVLAELEPSESLSSVWSSTFLFESVDGNLLYKFLFTEKDATGNITDRFFGYSSSVSRPQTATSPASYFYLVPDASGYSDDYTYSLNRTLHDGRMLTVTVDMSAASEAYTHSITVR